LLDRCYQHHREPQRCQVYLQQSLEHSELPQLQLR
jgi:hypothetical protein